MNSKQEALFFLHTNLRFLFEEEMNPTLANAQDLVPKPSGIDLEEWINEGFSVEWKVEDCFSDDEEEQDCISEKSDEPIKPKSYQNQAYYISGADESRNVDDIPIVNLSINSDEPKNSPLMNTLKKKPKKYSIKKDVDLPHGITLEHALSSTTQGRNENAEETLSATSLKLEPFIPESLLVNTTAKKKEKQKRKPKSKDQCSEK